MPDDGEEVDEDVAAEQVVDLLLARAVEAHQALEHDRLVGRVVVDVHVWIGAQALVEEVDELLERALLALAVVRPEGSEGRPAVLAPEDAEEVLEPAVGRPERVALDVEEDVARRGLRQQLEAALRRRLEQVIRVPPGHACAVLERGLVAQRLEGARRHARDLAVRWRGGELGERADARLLEPRNLVAAQARDERQVVVPLPLRPAAFAEVADRAVRDGQRVRLGRVGDELEEALPDAPVVGHEVAGPVGVAQPGPEQDVHERRLAPGDAGELLGVEAELEDVSRLRGAGELRVGRLVGAVRLPLEEVRDPAPPLVDEDALVDDVDASGERLRGLGGGALPVELVAELDLGDAQAAGAQLGEVSALVLVAFAPDQLGLRVVSVRSRERAARDRRLERGQVRAGKKRRQVGRREGQPATVINAHVRESWRRSGTTMHLINRLGAGGERVSAYRPATKKPW